ncbi:MAG: hypothetical protein JWN74_2421 [Acidobacteriaceae bacterium]|jgi:hypothetical protein|nr:hypothetical protein [Acidobacteriaceae bacterium]
MVKAYVMRWERLTDEASEHRNSSEINVEFDHRAEKAARFKTRASAEYECSLLDSFEIKIPTAERGEHLCKGFKVEELSPSEFVIYYEGPFILPKAS